MQSHLNMTTTKGGGFKDYNKMYAVTAQGGLFTTVDGGSNWTVSAGTDNLTSRCASICIDYTDDQVIYLGTGDPDYYYNGEGLYKSTDGGATFTATTLTNCLVDEILQDPLDPLTFIAATNKGMYKSIDNAVTWTSTTATNLHFCDLKANAATNSHILYACTNDNSAAPNFYRSTDFGSTWTQITAGIVAATANIQGGARIGVTPADTNVVYFASIGGLGIIHKSTDGGLNFSVVKAEGIAPNLTGYDKDGTSSGQGNYNNCVFVDRDDANKLWYQSQNMFKSIDGGVTWIYQHKWSEEVHTDGHQFDQNPLDVTKKLYNANDGGIWTSVDEGTTWTPISNGLYAYEITNEAGKSSHTDRDYCIIGTQDNGKIYRDGNAYVTIQGGDDYDKKEYDYLPNGGYYYNRGNQTRTPAPGSRTYLSYGLPAAVDKVEQIAFNRTNPEVGFVGRNNIFRTEDLSQSSPSWVQISNFSTTIMAINSSIADINRLYVITNDKNIYVSSNAMDATPTFTQHTLPSSSNDIASIAVMANDANTIYISINAKVYVSTDAGANWTDITYNLPAVNHRRILAEEYGGTEELVFIATNNAVYYKKAGQTTWTNYSTNLPGRRAPTDFSMFDDGTDQALIRFATFGRGLWESPFDNLRVADASFTVDNQNPCPGESVQFTEASTNFTATSWSWTFQGGTPATSTLENPSVSFTGTNPHDVTLTVSDGTDTHTKTMTGYITTKAFATLPYTSDFEGTFPPTNWSLQSTGRHWEKSTTVGGFGTSTNSAEFVNFATGQKGKMADMITLPIDITATDLYGATLSFDVAYAQYVAGSVDSLMVYASTDCGATYTSIYKKVGTELKTISPKTASFTPSASDWRKDSINISAYAGQTVIFKIRFGSAGGNNIYLDNVNVAQAVLEADFTASTTTVPCTGNTVTFTDASTAPLPVTTWAWTFAGGTPATSSVENPVVTYNTEGTYDVSLTVTDGSGHTSSKTETNYITINDYCSPDNVPGMAGNFSGGSNYATTPSLSLGSTNTFSISAWIKIEQNQPSFAGIILTDSEGTKGLNFRNDNEIGYFYKSSTSYNWTGGPIIAKGEWVHVALAIAPSSATIYVNGVAYVHSLTLSAANINGSFLLGSYPGRTDRTMTGQMDEVCIYNRTLSQSEIRELMHRVKNVPTVDASLKAYYQFNEPSGVIVDRTGNGFDATFGGTSGRVTSTAPVGNGTSELQSITSTGVKTFTNEGIELSFGTSVPNGEICVTRLNLQPDAAPTGKTLANSAAKYWIINNYGTNSGLDVTSLTATGFGNISASEAATPSIYSLYKRNTGDFASGTWNTTVTATSATAGTDGSIVFTSPVTAFNAQFTIVKDPIFITWTGVTDSDWNTATNWSPNGVPDASTSVIIPDVTNDPIVNEAPGTPAVCQDLTITTGVLTIAAGKALTVSGTLTNNVALGLKILSNATETGSLIANTVAGTGTANIERYLPTNDWHLVSSPVSGQNMKVFADNNSIDQFGGTYDIGTHSESAGIWNYNVSTTSSTDVFEYGIGNSIRRTVAGGAGVVAFTGSLFTTTADVPITRANFGWECVTNPFPSAMDIATFLSANSGQLDGTYSGIYRWEATDYISAITGNMAMAQAFFVKSKTGGGLLTYTPAMSTHGADNFKSAEMEWPKITLTVNSGKLENKTWIQFNNEMTIGLDYMYDRGKLKGNENIALYTRLLDDIGVDFETQALPETDIDKYRIPVGLDLPAGGEVAFTALSENLSNEAKLYLEDRQAKTFTSIGGINENYTVTLEKGASGFGRFYLLTGEALTTSSPQPEKTEFYVFTRDKTIFINGKTTNNTLLELYSIDGKLLFNKEAGFLNQNKIEGHNLPAGIYLLNIKSGGVNQTFKAVIN